MRSHNVTSHLTQINAPALNPGSEAGTQLTYCKGMDNRKLIISIQV